MCGIAGSINYPLDIPLLTKDLFHRGPDEQTTFSENGLILHHHRLAILDIAGGKQQVTRVEHAADRRSHRLAYIEDRA